MKIMRIPTYLLSFKLVLLLGTLVYASSVITPYQEWKRSDKKDEIETFYQTEKVGTDRFVVKVKVKNNRPKAVRVLVQLQYNNAGLYPGSNRRSFFYPQSGASYGKCVLIVPSGGVSLCDEVTVTTTKVTGVKIIRWDYTD